MLVFGLVCKLSLRSGPDHTALGVLQRSVRGWLEKRLPSKELIEQKQARRREQDFQSPAGRVWEFKLSTVENNTTWLTEVRALTRPTEPRDVTLTVAVRVGMTDTRVAPVQYFVETPAFVRTLPHEFVAQIGGSQLAVTPRKVQTSADVEWLLNELRDADRGVPLIVVTEPAHEPPAIAKLGEKLASFLSGLAIVVDVERSMTFELTSALGKELSCFDGGVRVYWPGWTPHDSPALHPLLWKKRIAISAAHDITQPDKLVRNSLMEMLTRAAAARFAYPRAMMEVIAAGQHQALQRALTGSSAQELIGKIDDLASKLGQQTALAEMAMAENSQLRDENDGLRREIASLRAEIARRSAGAGDGAPAAQSPWEMTDVNEAIERARQDFRSTLAFPDNIDVDTRLSGGFWYHVLLTLHELCEKERRGDLRSKRQTLRELLVTHLGLSKDTYKAGDTDVYARDPETHQRVHLRERVHLKEGRPSETESAYWTTLGDSRDSYRYLVGKLGRHA